MSIQLLRLKELLSYGPDTGNFTWLTSRGKAKAGDIAGHLEHTGYISIRIDGKSYLAHRLAWFYFFGSFPESDLDHINGVKTDNSIDNLRLATKFQNRQNLSTKGFGSNPRIGVHLDNSTNKWRARIMVNGKRFCLGSFNTPEEAGRAYDLKKQDLHNFSPKLRKV